MSASNQLGPPRGSVLGKTAGVLVSVFYPIIVVVGVLLLASVQMRSLNGGAGFDTWRLQYKSNRDSAVALLKDFKSLRDSESENFDDLKFTELCLKQYTPDGRWVENVDQQQKDDAIAARMAGKKSEEFAGIKKCLMRGLVSLQFDQQRFEVKKDDFAREIMDARKEMATNTDQYNELVKSHQDFVALSAMESTWYFKPTAVMPYDLMVLLLVMFMGALGGMVRLLREYGDRSRPNPTATDYLFIPLIGLVVAIGGYILAKTGLLLLSSTRDETSLSPFMIGLVGIVSGLLAKEVIDAISRAGKKILNTDKGADARHAGAGKEDRGGVDAG